MTLTIGKTLSLRLTSIHSPDPQIENAHSKAYNHLDQKICQGCASKHASLCNVMDNDDLDILSRLSSDIHKKAKQIICTEGDNAKYLYNIRSGAVRISKMLPDGRRQITGFLFTGDFFGLSCGAQHSYTAEAITPVEICRFPRKKIITLFQEFPNLNERVFDMTRTELNSTHAQMLLLGRKTAKEKLCSFLLTMRKKTSLLAKKSKDEIGLPMNRSDIADYLGLTIETVSRQFTNLNKLGLIKLDGADKVSLKNIERLSIMAEGGRILSRKAYKTP
ncbi:MAG: Crp/Fnr family transcriptional regulator [Alphaproteobacteria bacterium]|nr:MAG: Crp/Fnr family transcriptional regulator [Alphaproteobacteria bacterium]